MKVLKEALQGRAGNAILPFLWVHGEEETKIRAGIAQIAASGIGEFCVEARPHPDFVGPRWWHDLDIILDEAKKRAMRVWILDDAHFPTGYLNGRLSEFPQARKLLADHYGVDVVGPAPGSAFMLRLEREERLIGVVACRRDRADPNRMLEAVDLTARAQGDTVFWDVPEGLWCVLVLKATYNGHDRLTHVNILDRDVVRLLLDICYEPHYAHYRAEFGKTIAGFFSDEPQVGNASSRVVGVAQVGNKAMPLSWTAEIEARLRAAWGERFAPMLAACWYQLDGLSPAARLAYMNEVSRSFQVNFSEQVGGWCRERGVEYIGHVIEDNGSHMRLGHGPAHFFRALWGQDMAGVDVVLQQIRPGLEDTQFLKISGREYFDGRFFHNLLAKLAASLAHLDPKKKGRALCEIFGAYGWSEGLKLMKWLADHMLVRGINAFVPHAFDLAAFPDEDCPPHFYAWGNNPQFPFFRQLMDYMNRVSHLIQGGRHIPCVALLYSAEGEWMDRESAQPLEEVCLALNRAQIDYEIVPGDVLVSAPVENRRFRAGEETFRRADRQRTAVYERTAVRLVQSRVRAGRARAVSGRGARAGRSHGDGSAASRARQHGRFAGSARRNASFARPSRNPLRYPAALSALLSLRAGGRRNHPLFQRRPGACDRLPRAHAVRRGRLLVRSLAERACRGGNGRRRRASAPFALSDDDPEGGKQRREAPLAA